MTMGDATAWVTSSSADLGLVVTSAGERTHDQPWSSTVVYDVRDADGMESRVWFKANGIGTRHEPELISALGSLVPDLVPRVLAIDAERAWSLTGDTGPTWRSTFAATDQWPLWEDLLQRYAAAQLTLAAHRTELLATGTPERSPATLPDQAADLVAELTLLDAGSGGLSVAASQGLTARLPAYGQWCRDLDAAGIPWTIQHDDLHANNICRPVLSADPAVDSTAAADPATAGRSSGQAAAARIIDWGDASIGHPFGTLLVTLRSIAHYSGCDVDDPAVRRVRDAYLEPFAAYGSPAELIALVELARRVGVVTRALSWRAGLMGATAAVQREHEFPVRDWLEELLTPSP